ncbi:hypothetical protein SESBI_23884 [Sesbania bispinosa]|nr:hypothetical protein SESBI_23884 [Sesbania bispinosa]
MRSARVSTPLSQEEKDQLDRSTKKAKTCASQDTVVEETRVIVGQENEEVQAEDVCKNSMNGGSTGVPHPTTIGESLRRKLISYKDACIGINGAST